MQVICGILEADVRVAVAILAPTAMEEERALKTSLFGS